MGHRVREENEVWTTTFILLKRLGYFSNFICKIYILFLWDGSWSIQTLIWLVTVASFYGHPNQFYYLLDNYYILCHCLFILPLFIHAVAKGLGDFRGIKLDNFLRD
jgi:hypothetical protein